MRNLKWVFALYLYHTPSPLPNVLLLSRIVSELTPSQNLADVGMLRHVGSQPWPRQWWEWAGRGGARPASHTETFMTDKYDTKYILLTCNWIWTLLTVLVSHLDTDHPIWSTKRMKAGAVVCSCKRGLTPISGVTCSSSYKSSCPAFALFFQKTVYLYSCMYVTSDHMWWGHLLADRALLIIELPVTGAVLGPGCYL